MICQNCGKGFEGNYCGQKAGGRRIEAKYVRNKIPNSIFQLDRGFLFTLKELFIRPGHSIRDFLAGKRKSHYKPFSVIKRRAFAYVIKPNYSFTYRWPLLR